MIAALADHQHGVAAHRQLLALGLGCGAVRARLASGRLHRVHQGVYAVGHRGLTPHGHRLAAVLTCGSAAALSHKSAGALWGLLATAQTYVDVTVPGTSRRRRRLIRVHRARRLAADEVQVLDGIPVTSIARTILDLAGVLTAPALLRGIEQAERNGQLDLRALHRMLERHPSRRGTAALRTILADYDGAPATRSELERRFLEIVTAAGLPAPQLNVSVAGELVDVYWPQWRLVVELDSRRFHSDHAAFERDRIRDIKLQRTRRRVLRITHRRCQRESAGVVDDILALAALAEADRPAAH